MSVLDLADSRSTYDDQGKKRREDETHIDGHVREPDKPAISRALLKARSMFCGSDAAGRILAANSNAQEEAIYHECQHHIFHSSAGAIRCGLQNGEDDDDDGGDE